MPTKRSHQSTLVAATATATATPNTWLADYLADLGPSSTPTRVPYGAPDFNATIAQQLAAVGVVIVTGVLEPTEISDAIDKMQAWQQSVPDYGWLHANLDPHGVHKFHQAGHQEFAWAIRLNTRVRRTFAHLHGVSDVSNGLVASMDGSCYIPSDNRKVDNCWLHTDQAPKQQGRRCIQGFVSLTSNTSTGPTFVCVPCSHLVHRAYFVAQGMGAGGSNFQKIERRHVDALRPGQKVALDVPAGSLVLWDSRTFHQNQYGLPGNGQERRVQYVCYLPKDHPGNTPAMQRKRLQYLKDMRTTSHWPYPLRVNGLQGQTFGQPRRRIDYSQLTPPDLRGYGSEIAKLV